MKDIKEYEDEASKVVKLISKAEFMKAAAKTTSRVMADDSLDPKASVSLLLVATLIIPKLATELFDREEDE